MTHGGSPPVLVTLGTSPHLPLAPEGATARPRLLRAHASCRFTARAAYVSALTRIAVTSRTATISNASTRTVRRN